jgi:hypothetical protein
MTYFTNPPALSFETAHRIGQAVSDVGAVQAALECLSATLNGDGICPESAHNLLTMLNRRLDDVALTLMAVSDELQTGGGR